MKTSKTSKIFLFHAKRKKKYLVVFAVLLLGVILARQVIPSGLGGMRQIIPFLFFSEKRGQCHSPNDDISLVFYTNDAGAAHSGMFPTWVILKHWYGDEVIAKGYLEESRGDIPLVWTGPRSIRIGFVKGPYDETPSPQNIGIPH